MKLCLLSCSAKDKGLKVKYLKATSSVILRRSPLLVDHGSLGNKLFWMVFLTRLFSVKLKNKETA